MKKVLVTLAVLAISTTSAFAASIVGTRHDLSSVATHNGLRSDSNQICIFCHTPHNAVVNKLLWNRQIPTTTYSFFTSTNLGTAMATVLKGSALNSNSSSVLCLSCHDRSVAQILSDMGTLRGGATTITDVGGFWGNFSITNDQGKTGNLTNDHPIGFSYNLAQNLNTPGLLTDVQAAAKFGVPVTSVFFGSTGNMECASCHLTHDNTYGFFLRLPGTQSQICLACHIK